MITPSGATLSQLLACSAQELVKVAAELDVRIQKNDESCISNDLFF